MSGNNEDSDSEYEDVVVLAEFRDLLDKDIRNNIEVVRVLGVDTRDANETYIQINNYFFKGQFEKCLGTHMFFEKDPDPPEMDPIFMDVPKNPLRYVCKTPKVLNMQRVFVTRKEGSVNEDNVQNVYPEFEPHASTTEEALERFQAYMDENDKEPSVRSREKPSCHWKTGQRKI